MNCLPEARGATSLRTTHFRLSTVRYCVKHKHGDPGGLAEVRIKGQRRGGVPACTAVAALQVPEGGG